MRTGHQTARFRREKNFTRFLVFLLLLHGTIKGNGCKEAQPPQPYFLMEFNPTTVTALSSRSAFINCYVVDLQFYTMSFLHNGHIISSQDEIVTFDPRYKLISTGFSKTLILTDVTKADEGEIQCQISTETPTSIKIKLVVIEPKLSITPPEALIVMKAGCKFNLTCQIDYIDPQLVDGPVWWIRDGKYVELDQTRSTKLMLHNQLNGTVKSSTISFHSFDLLDTGEYTCKSGSFGSIDVTILMWNGRSKTKHVFEVFQEYCVSGSGDRIWIRQRNIKCFIVALLCFLLHLPNISI